MQVDLIAATAKAQRTMRPNHDLFSAFRPVLAAD
jgi:hypothetical protein